MNIGGFQKLTLLDYPGETAATIFLSGCNYRCPFCHNGQLLEEGPLNSGVEEALWQYLRRRRGLIDGVCITGGEPLLNPDLPQMIARIRAMGYKVKVDTNGSRPQALKALLNEGLVDYVAMDIKGTPEKYPRICGRQAVSVAAVKESAALLMGGAIPYEFRTTVVKEFHQGQDFEVIGHWLTGAKAYYLQRFRLSDQVLDQGLHPCLAEEMKDYLRIVQKYIPQAECRGQA